MIKSISKNFSCIICIFLVTSCLGNKKFIPITDKSKQYQIYNISYSIPAEGDWYIADETEFQLYLASGKKNEYETFGAKIEILNSKKPYSNEEAYELMRSRFLSEEKTKYRDRYKIIDSNSSHSIEKDTFCIKLYSKVRDYKPSKKPSDVNFLIMETLERICRHPKDTSKFVIIGFSQRSVPNKITPGFSEKAEQFFGNIIF